MLQTKEEKPIRVLTICSALRQKFSGYDERATASRSMATVSLSTKYGNSPDIRSLSKCLMSMRMNINLNPCQVSSRVEL